MNFVQAVALGLLLLLLGGAAAWQARRDVAWRPLAAVLLGLAGLTLVAALLGLVLFLLYLRTVQ